MSATSTVAWQSLIHSTTSIFSPEAQEEVFQRFRSTPNIRSASLTYDAEEHWFEVSCLATDADNASKTLALILSSFDAADPSSSISRIDSFIESVVDWHDYWQKVDDEQAQHITQNDDKEYILVDFGQRSERQLWTAKDPEANLDVLIPANVIKEIAYLTGCQLERDPFKHGISITPGPTGDSLAALRKLCVIEEDQTRKEPLISHVLKTQKVDQFEVTFERLVDSDRPSHMFDSSLTRTLFPPDSPLYSQGKDKSKGFSKLHHARLFKPRPGSRFPPRQERNVNPMDPGEHRPASRMFASVTYVDMGIAAPTEITAIPAPETRDPTMLTVESWMEKIDDAGAIAIPAVPAVQTSVGRESDKDKSGTAIVASHRTNVPVSNTHSQAAPRISTFAETPVESQEWAQAPSQELWNNPVSHDTGWKPRHTPGSTPHHYPPLRANVGNLPRAPAPTISQDIEFNPGTRNVGRAGFEQRPHDTMQQATRGGAQFATRGPSQQRGPWKSLNAVRGGRGNHSSTIRPRETADPSRERTRSSAGRGRGRGNTRASSSKAPVKSTNAFAALDDVDQEVEEEEDDRRFIRTRLRAPAPASKKKKSPTKKKPRKVDPLESLRAAYSGSGPKSTLSSTNISGLPSVLEDGLSSGNESGGNTSENTTLPSTHPSTGGATTSSTSQIYADLQGLCIGSGVDSYTRAAVTSIHQALEHARSFRGTIEVVAQTGRIILSSAPKLARERLTQDTFVSTVRDSEDSKGLRTLDGGFTNVITSSMTDMDCLLDIVGVRPSDSSYESSTVLRFDCIKPDKSIASVIVPMDERTDEAHVLSPEKVFGLWYAHHPQRVWDSRTLVTGYVRSDIERYAGGLNFVNDLFVRKEDEKLAPDIQGRDDNGLELRAAQVQTKARYRVRLGKDARNGPQEQDCAECYVEIKRVLDLPIYRQESTAYSQSRVFFAKCLTENQLIKDHRLWYEVSFGFVTSPRGFRENATTLEMGDKTSWKPEGAISEQDLVGLHSVVTRTVEKMDNIGARNEGPGAKYENKEYRKALDRETVPDKFW